MFSSHKKSQVAVECMLSELTTICLDFTTRHRLCFCVMSFILTSKIYPFGSNIIFFVIFAGFEDLNFSSGDSKINLVHDGNGYHGLVEEGATVVNVTPPIKVEKTNGRELLCKILILQDGQRDDESPFEV